MLTRAASRASSITAAVERARLDSSRLRNTRMIGQTMTTAAWSMDGYPLTWHPPARARIIGVELDADNAALCRENVRPWADRCKLVEGAAWSADGEVMYERRRGCEQGFHVTRQHGNATAPAISLNTLLGRHGWDRVDFVKMDIEGAEQQVLRRATEWAERVRSIKVEVHGAYTMNDCAGDLRALGFDTRFDDRHWAAVIGQRPLS